MTRQRVAPPVMPESLHGEKSDAPDVTMRASTLEVVSWLLRYPLLRASDLATLMGLSASATAARLAQARADGLLRSIPASLLGRHVARLHVLTPRGLTALAERDGSIVWERARCSQADATGLLQLLSDLPAVLATQAFALALIGHAEEALCRQPTQRIMWSWTRRECLRSLSTDKDQHAGHPSLRGDASIWLVVRSAVQGAAASYWLMILWDSGLSRVADVRRELQTLLRIRNSYERQGMLSAFPTLLVLAPDERSAALWQAQALRLATERWLTHPLLGGALALDVSTSLLSSSATLVESINPWQAAWRSFAQPGTQMLSDIVQAGGKVGARPSALWQMSRRTAHMRDGVEAARLILRLNARSLRILIALYLHPLLSTPHLAVMLDIQPTSVERMLLRLRRLDLVRVQSWGNVQHGALSDRGALLLARCAHLPGGACTFAQASSRPPCVLRRYQREVQALARTPDHTEGVYSFFTRLLQSCGTERAQGYDVALLWWEIGSMCIRAFHDADGWQVIRPDGAGEWRMMDRRFRFWLEWDRGTMGLRDLGAKFAAYARYVGSLEWRTADDAATAALPLLLIVTSSPEQETRIKQSLSASLPPTGPLAVYLATGAALSAQQRGPFAPIWHLYGRHRPHGARLVSPFTSTDAFR